MKICRFNIVFCFLLIYIACVSCGTFYVPQILPEGRGISRAEGQEKIEISIIPLTSKVIEQANEDNYERRIVDSGDLSRAARLISVDQAINEKIPTKNDPGPYRLGVGDSLTFSQIISGKDELGITRKQIVSRNISIADDGFASIIGLGRVPLAGLTQFEAEDLLYERLVLEEVDSEFELYISGFLSKKIQVTNNLLENKESANTNKIKKTGIFEVAYSNYPIYMNEILSKSGVVIKQGEDAQIELIRGKETFRISLRNLVEGKYNKIRLFPDDHIIINSLPYRPETAVIMGEVINPRLYELSPSNRKTLSEALYGDGTFDLVTSDTSQIYLLRPKRTNKVIGYHLDASNPTRLILANKLELRPGDIIYVAPQPVTTYNRALMQIFGAYAINIVYKMTR